MQSAIRSSVAIVTPLLVVYELIVQHLIVECEPLVVQWQDMPKLVAFGVQVGLVVLVGLVHDRNLIGYRQSVPGERVDLLRVVGEQADARESQVDKDLSADSVITKVCR